MTVKNFIQEIRRARQSLRRNDSGYFCNICWNTNDHKIFSHETHITYLLHISLHSLKNDQLKYSNDTFSFFRKLKRNSIFEFSIFSELKLFIMQKVASIG